MIEIFPAVFRGKSATMTWVKVDDGNLFIRKTNKFIPYLNDWTHKSGHLQEKLKIYEERPMFDPITGKRGDMLRFFPFSLEDYSEDYTQINSDFLIELESKRVEVNHLLRILVTLKEIIKQEGLLDIIKQKMVDDYDFLNKIKPHFVTIEKHRKPKK